MSWGDFGGWRPYVSAAQRRAKAARAIGEMKRKGLTVTPVAVDGRAIARTFWGKAWCENLEAYSDFANRLPRGRTYVRNGSVLDLAVAAGSISALVSGSEIYTIEIAIDALKPASWRAMTRECAGQIDSLVELLQGRFSKGVMEVVTRKGTGLFPAPKEIRMTCSCPDWAGLCKHLAAVLYGVGARLDEHPELLFLLRNVDEAELVSQAASAPLAGTSAKKARAEGLDEAALSGIFGIDLDVAAEPAASGSAARRGRLPKRRKKRTESSAGTTLTSTELRARGISSPTIQSWLREGVLLRTGRRGSYRATPATEMRIARYLEKKHR